MPKNLPTTIIEECIDLEPSQILYDLVRFKNKGVVPKGFRFANSPDDVVSNGHTYTGYPFSLIAKPPQKKGEQPVMRMRMSNVGQELQREFQRVLEDKNVWTVDVFSVLANDKDTPFDMYGNYYIYGTVDYGLADISIQMTPFNHRQQEAGTLRFDSRTTPNIIGR